MFIMHAPEGKLHKFTHGKETIISQTTFV